MRYVNAKKSFNIQYTNVCRTLNFKNLEYDRKGLVGSTPASEFDCWSQQSHRRVKSFAAAIVRRSRSIDRRRYDRLRNKTIRMSIPYARTRPRWHFIAVPRIFLIYSADQDETSTSWRTTPQRNNIVLIYSWSANLRRRRRPLRARAHHRNAPRSCSIRSHATQMIARSKRTTIETVSDRSEMASPARTYELYASTVYQRPDKGKKNNKKK